MKSNLVYGDIIYDRALNYSFPKKESILYKTGVESHLRKVQGETYQELGSEFLQKRRWCRKMFQ